MTAAECAREKAVIAAVRIGAWPGSCDGTLVAHVADCVSCAEVVQVAEAFRTDFESVGKIHVPAAGQVWWRAAVRARMESAHAAARPMTWVQGVTAACAAGAVCAILAFTWPAISGVATTMAGLVAEFGPDRLEVVSPMLIALTRGLPLLFAIAGCVVMAPLVILYFALSDD